MDNENRLLDLLGIASLGTIIFLSVALISKIQKIKQLLERVNKLDTALNETDEQAKLIVRTDIELNKAQEELDKKITGLYTLHRLSREISTTLEEKQIFEKIDAASLGELGFSKALAFMRDEQERKFNALLNIGYPEEDKEAIKLFLYGEERLFLEVLSGDNTLSSITKTHDARIIEKVKAKFNCVAFVIAPILPKEGNKGFIFVGTDNADVPLTEGDEELITILASQIGQALENARLFEKTWSAQQGLENKIRERTRELSAALEEVETVNRRKTEFVSNVSHELRTPLTSIKGYASILLAGKLGEVPPEVRLRLEKINKHSDELAQFVNDLLDIARLESGRVEMKLAEENLEKIAEEVADLLSVQLKDKQLELALEIPEEARKVQADYSQIKRVLINLVNNAVKFTPAQGKIKITGQKVDNQVQVDVSDTGCGIPREAQDKIFHEFYRVDNPINQQVKGTGLGLAMVKNIIEAHKGRVWARSLPGSGTTFSFILPQ